MKWPWTKPHPKHGTLTLLDGEPKAIIGFPNDAPEDMIHAVIHELQALLDDPTTGKSVLVFPFPVDVTDLRR